MITLLSFLCFIGFTAHAQEQVLTYDEFIQLVLQEHPVAKQADLQSQFADVEMLKARGVIDPKISMQFDQKQFDDKDYFDLFKSEIKIPTVLGLDVKANFESANGEFVNPQNLTTNQGLWSAGVEMDVLRNWAYNERKAAFDAANVFSEQATNQQEIILNQLIVDASFAYIYWYTANENVKIVEENLELAEIYLENIKDAVNLGDKPAIDTIEARTILLDQIVIYQEQELERVKAKFMVNNFLWENNSLLFLHTNTVPENPNFFLPRESVSVEEFYTHPEVVEKQLKVDQIDIKARLAKQQLLPQLQLGYYPLVPTNEDVFLPAGTEVANYKVGANFSVPLFRRKEKAALQKTGLESDAMQIDLYNKANELYVKWNIEDNNFDNLGQQINLLEEAQENYEALADAELIRYNYGESSVFLVNKRLEKLIENRLKIQKLNQKQLETQIKQLYLENLLLP